MHSFLRRIPETYVRNKKVVSLLPANIGGWVNKNIFNNRCTIDSVSDATTKTTINPSSLPGCHTARHARPRRQVGTATRAQQDSVLRIRRSLTWVPAAVVVAAAAAVDVATITAAVVAAVTAAVAAFAAASNIRILWS